MSERELLTLTEDELLAITGYSQPARQLRALHAHGFTRARLSPRTGRVVLERAHYHAVAEGRAAATSGAPARPRPRVRQPAAA